MRLCTSSMAAVPSGCSVGPRRWIVTVGRAVVRNRGTEIIGTVHAVDMKQALTAAKKYHPDYWFVTPKSQRRANERVVQ